MTSLTIPTGYRSALALIARMPDADLDSLLNALSSDQVNARPFSKLADRIRQRTSVSIAELNDLVDVLTALYSVRLGSERPLNTFAREVSTEMKRTDSEGGEKISEAEGRALEERLGRLLSIESLTVAAKASDLEFGYERVFESARIFTDIRPVFGGEGSSEVRGAIIINQMRISCVEGANVKDIFVALDQEDLMALKKVIERAEAKTKTLAALLVQAGVCDLDANKE